MRKLFLFMLTLLVCYGCSDDDINNIEESFVNEEDIIGIWTITNLKYEGEDYPVPEDYIDCGRNYIEFKENNVVKERVFRNSDCNFSDSQYQWRLQKKSIIFTSNGATDKWDILSINTTIMIVSLRFDVDGDGRLDTLEATLTKYEPPYIGHSELNFKVQFKKENFTALFSWYKFEEPNYFSAYKIYESNEFDTQGNLIHTSSNIDDITYELDFSSKAIADYYYTIEVIGKDGTVLLVDKTQIQDHVLYNYDLEIISMERIDNQKVKISIQPYETLAFDHYEISFSHNLLHHDLNPILLNVSDMATTEFIIDIPMLPNPKFWVRAMIKKDDDIIRSGVDNQTLNYTRKELLDLDFFKGSQVYNIPSNDDIFLFPFWTLMSYNTSTLTQTEIFNRSHTGDLKYLNADTYLQDNAIKFYFDHQIYTVDIQQKNLKSVVETQGINKLIWLKNKDVYIGTNYNNINVLQIDENGNQTVISSIVNPNPSGELMKTGNNKFIQKLSEDVWQEFVVDNNNHISATQKIFFEPRSAVNIGFLDMSKNEYLDFSKKQMIAYPSGNIIKTYSFEGTILSYNAKDKLIYVGNYDLNNFGNAINISDQQELYVYDVQGNKIRTYTTQGFPVHVTANDDGSLNIISTIENRMYESNYYFIEVLP